MSWRSIAALLALLVGGMSPGCETASTGPTPPTQDAGPGDLGTRDGGATDPLDGCFEGLERGATDPFIGTLTLRSTDGSVRVRIARQPGDRPFVGETWPYDLLRFGVTSEGVTTCVTESSALGYTFGHHNWNDEAMATGESDYSLTMVYSFATDPAGWSDELSIDGALPIPLELESCETDPPEDLNHCLLRSEQ